MVAGKADDYAVLYVFKKHRQYIPQRRHPLVSSFFFQLSFAVLNHLIQARDPFCAQPAIPNKARLSQVGLFSVYQLKDGIQLFGVYQLKDGSQFTPF